MTSAITTAREGLEAALVAQGLRIQDPGASIAPPAVMLIPGDPWLAPSTLGGKTRDLAIQLVGILATAADKAQRLDAEDMAQKISDAIAATNAPPWAIVTIDPPTSYDLGGVAYIAVIGTTRTTVMGGS